MSTSHPCPTGLMERFGAFIGRVKQAVADGSGRNKALMGPITILLWRYLSRTLDRLSKLHARFIAGTLPPPRPAGEAPRRAAAERQTAAEARKNPRIPAGHVFMPYHVGHLQHAMRELFADPELLALLAAAPQARRLLRPLWRRMTADPLPDILKLPKRPRRSCREIPAAPDTKPPAEAAPARPIKSPAEKPPPRRAIVPDEERAVWVWHPPPLKGA